MEKYHPSCDDMEEDDYIDMDISSREFEFQMSFNSIEREVAASPADELFYKGNLLPLHLPPRLQMVQKLLECSTTSRESKTDASQAGAPSFESRNIPMASSCRLSGELSVEEYMHEPKKSWSKKLNLSRQSFLSRKLKASKACLRSLFTTKSECSDHLKAKKKLFLQLKKEMWLIQDNNTSSSMTTIKREKKTLDEECTYRRSFSGAINCNLITRSSPAMSSRSSSSSSSSSVSSYGLCGSQPLNTSSSVNSEMESSIEGAIAYCKESHISARKSTSDVEFCSLSASRTVAACDNQERQGLCRG